MEIKIFLERIKQIIGKSEEIAQLKQESFNIFSILRSDSDEEKLHSVFLAELLNCKGSHGLGSTFCQLFVDRICKGEFAVDETVKVTTEKHIDKLGRIDIYLENSLNELIVIENKIYAGDQNKQLVRYDKHIKNSPTKQGILLYLTLDGKEASDESAKSKDGYVEYQTVSYKSEIISWLQDCLKESVDYPTVRETIKQYVILLKKLTNQLTDQVMEKDIKKLISENYKTSKIISDTISKVELDMADVFLKEVESLVLNELNGDWVVERDENLNKKYSGIRIRSNKWTENIVIKLEGQSSIPWHHSVYGIVADKNKIDRVDVMERLRDVEILKNSEFKQSDGWPFYKIIIDMRSVKNREKLFDNCDRKNLVDVVSNQLIDLAKACKMLLIDVKER
jgi:hypothetical protein